MVHLMGSGLVETMKGKGGSKKAPVKPEFDDSSEPLESLYKRPKLDSSSQESAGHDTFSVPSSMYNPLEEPSPLGLRLRKSPSLLDLIQMKLSQDSTTAKLATLSKKNHKGNAISGAPDKLKASNFPASILKIGTWQYKSRYEGDLVAKCYFAKHKLVWEVLDGSLKNKIEIQWSDIVALKANYPDDEPGTLDVVLARPPLFFRETNPQPRKHTLWQTTSDFTGGQASIHRQHFLQCPPGLLGRHFEKLIQCDPRLNFLSQQPEIVLESPYFEPRVTTTQDPNELSREFDAKTEGPVFFGLHEATCTSGAESSSKTEREFVNRAASEISSPRSEFKGLGAENSKFLNNLEQIKVPGLHPSMSMSDLVSHIGQCLSEKMASSNPVFPGKEQSERGVLEEITQYLFSDSQHSLASDEQSLMSRVNSLCCLLHKVPSTAQLCNGKSVINVNSEEKVGDINSISGYGNEGKGPRVNSNDVSDCKQSQVMSKKDSFGDLLLSLPRIASLPQFLFHLSQDSDNQAR